MSSEPHRPVRPWNELRTAGLLWLINTVVFHPRGFALAFHMEGGEPVGWHLLGDGSEPWRFVGPELDDLFDAAEATFAEQRKGAER